MLLAVAAEAGSIELNYSWLPTWLGINTPLKLEIESALAQRLIGKPMTNETLLEAHDLIVEFLVKRFPNIVGLRDYLDSLKLIEIT
jgi:hypothetical protein